MRNAILRALALPVLVASATLAVAADFSAPRGRERVVERQVLERHVVVPSAVLVPDCEERFDADLLRCIPRERVSEADAYAVAIQRKSMLVPARRPYPQLFSWDYP